jgi:hypothetical protein
VEATPLHRALSAVCEERTSHPVATAAVKGTGMSDHVNCWNARNNLRNGKTVRRFIAGSSFGAKARTDNTISRASPSRSTISTLSDAGRAQHWISTGGVCRR